MYSKYIHGLFGTLPAVLCDAYKSVFYLSLYHFRERHVTNLPWRNPSILLVILAFGPSGLFDLDEWFIDQ